MKKENREAVFRYWGYHCHIAQDIANKDIPATEVHHARIHNSKWARKKYPLFIDSLFNLRPVSHSFHMENPSCGKWSEKRVESIERGLQRHKIHAIIVNGGIKHER